MIDGGAGARGPAVPRRRRARPRSTTAAALREALHAAVPGGRRRRSSTPRRRRTLDEIVERGAGRGRGRVPAEGRVPAPTSGGASGSPRWTARCSRQVMLDGAGREVEGPPLRPGPAAQRDPVPRPRGQKDPLVEYKKEAFEMFEDLMQDIQVHLHRALPQDPGVARSRPRRRRRRRRRHPRRGRRRPDDLFTGAATLPPPPRPAPHGSGLAGPDVRRRAAAAGRRPAGGRPQRSVSLRLRQEVQEVPRGGEVTAA